MKQGGKGPVTLLASSCHFCSKFLLQREGARTLHTANFAGLLETSIHSILLLVNGKSKLEEKFFLLSNKTFIKAGAMIKYFQPSQTFLVSATHSKIFKGERMSLVSYLKYFSKACMSQKQLLPCSFTGCY